MADNGRCPACGSSNIARYKVVAWKCNACGAIFLTPLAAKAAEEKFGEDTETVQEE